VYGKEFLIGKCMTSPLSRAQRALQEQGPLGLARALWSYGVAQSARSYRALASPLVMEGAIKSFKREVEGIVVTEKLVEFAFRWRYKGIRIKPDQLPREILDLCYILRKHKVRSALEIGTAGGGSLFLFCRVAQPEARIISLDYPASALEARNKKYRDMLYKQFAYGRQELTLLTGSSHDGSMLLEVYDKLGGQYVDGKQLSIKTLDFLFIDGDHSYEGVKKDFEMYSQFVKKGGLIGFHDIETNKNVRVDTVRIFWNELKSKYKTRELCYSNGNGYGIGIVYW
jgi:predicted O-methyltransferase YrrM